MEGTSEVPNLTNFDPRCIPWQYKVLYDFDNKLDFSAGIQEILLSGAIGSAKTTLAAHIALRHVLENDGARMILGRLSLASLKETIFRAVLDHMDGVLEEGRDYSYDRTKAKLTFRNRSEILSTSWADRRFHKIRSLNISAAIIEEATETDGEYWQAVTEIFNRLGRQTHIKKNWMMFVTNPGDPSHPLYKRMITTDNPNRHTYYSVTADNPFLPEFYIENIKENLDAKMARRMLHGEWLSIQQDAIYHNYSTEQNFIKDKYEFDMGLPIDIMFDFNIAKDKPMSGAVGQYVGKRFHVAKTFIVDGARTADLMDEMAGAGVFEFPTSYRVFGDATGKHNDTRSKHSDYDIIKKFLSNHITKSDAALAFEMCVPSSNPPVRTRHNKMNAVFKNANGQVRFYLYQGAEEADEGLRLTKLKKGANYIEDDSFRLQHVTTAIGYWVCQVLKDEGRSFDTIYKKMF